VATKIKISAGDITLDVEGEDATVLEIYRDFKDSLTSRMTSRTEREDSSQGDDQSEDENGSSVAAPKQKRRAQKRRTNSAVGEKRAESYVPALDKSLKTPGIREYYSKWKTKNHPEKVLIFVEYLKTQGHEPCTGDQIFTCYQAAGVPRPKAFRQALVDARGEKFGYIDYKSYTEISSTAIGEDYLNYSMEKADASK
jgi:hypothetical protein